MDTENDDTGAQRKKSWPATMRIMKVKFLSVMWLVMKTEFTVISQSLTAGSLWSGSIWICQ